MWILLTHINRHTKKAFWPLRTVNVVAHFIVVSISKNGYEYEIGIDSQSDFGDWQFNEKSINVSDEYESSKRY